MAIRLVQRWRSGGGEGIREVGLGGGWALQVGETLGAGQVPVARSMLEEREGNMSDVAVGRRRGRRSRSGWKDMSGATSLPWWKCEVEVEFKLEGHGPFPSNRQPTSAFTPTARRPCAPHHPGEAHHHPSVTTSEHTSPSRLSHARRSVAL